MQTRDATGDEGFREPSSPNKRKLFNEPDAPLFCENRVVEDQAQSTVARDQESPTQGRLEDQIGWYDRKSQIAQRRYKMLKLAQVTIAGVIPLASVFPIPEEQFKWITAILGLLILIIEAVQQLNQDQQNWTAYRSTCEALKHEKYLYLAGAGPYGNVENQEKRTAMLADRIEGLISQEHAKWVSTQEQALARDRGTGSRPTSVDEGTNHS